MLFIFGGSLICVVNLFERCDSSGVVCVSERREPRHFVNTDFGDTGVIDPRD